MKTTIRVTNPSLSIPHGINDLYGANMLAAKHCGFQSPPIPIRGIWAHGWTASSMLIHPDFVVGMNSTQLRNEHYWVATKAQEQFLIERGYPNARAIGLPMTYVRRTESIERVQGSLLVMPVHSRPTTKIDYDFQEYARAINDIRSNFSRVVVCIHPSCWENGYWVEQFRNLGFELIQGASTDDPRALERLSEILSSFEFVTTNGFGSHIAYASFCGAKVSLFGRCPETKVEEHINEPFHIRNPEILPLAIESTSEHSLRKNFPFLFCRPWEATEQIDWAQRELGFDCRISSAEMRRKFGWRVSNRLTANFSARIRSAMPERVKHWMRLAIRPQYRRHHKEMARLRAMPLFTPAETNLLGPNLKFVDAESFRAMFSEIFEKETYLFETLSPSPLIIDGGANIGLSVIYFKLQHPKSKIIAFEPDPDLFSVLEHNCRSFGLTDVQLVNKALWANTELVKFARHGSEAGHISEHEGHDNVIHVQTCRLRDYIGETPIDLLKLDIEGAETVVLNDTRDQFSTIDRIIVEYHSFARRPQSLHELLNILNQANYRIHMHSLSLTQSPLYYRPTLCSMDFQANIYAFRE